MVSRCSWSAASDNRAFAASIDTPGAKRPSISIELALGVVNAAGFGSPGIDRPEGKEHVHEQRGVVAGETFGHDADHFQRDAVDASDTPDDVGCRR